MIKFENTEVLGWEHAIRGMRNPMNSWDKGDSEFHKDWIEEDLRVGPNDYKLMKQLANGGPIHAKYRRMITVYCDILAPLYWWKEFDTYKVGTVANSCSTMHKIHVREFTLKDFSFDHITNEYLDYYNPSTMIQKIIGCLNECRQKYLETKDKKYWWQMIQLLPSSYNQRRTVMLNYEVLANIYHYRKDHKLDEWRDFCQWITTLPYSEIITGSNQSKP